MRLIELTASAYDRQTIRIIVMSSARVLDIVEVTSKLLNRGNAISPLEAHRVVPEYPGYYAIWLDDAHSLPSPFSDYAQRRNQNLLYIGVGSKSLKARLVEQELQHKRAATFFRSLGAALGFRPEAGSLLGKRNKANYKFSESDTNEITRWATKHLLVNFVVSTTQKSIEDQLIRENQPLFNIAGNPNKLATLTEVRKECCNVALSSIV